MRTRDTQFKHTLLSNSSHIIYDGLSSRMFGITNVQPTNGLAEEIFLANTNLVTDQSRYSDKVYLLGVNREPLEFSMRLFFDPHTFDERKFQEMKKWFRQDTYKPFRYDSGKEQDLDVWVYAIITGQSKAYHNAIDDGYIDFTFRTNAPHRFSQIMEDEFDFTETNTNKMESAIKDGLYSLDESIDKLNSRLRQSIKRPELVSNDYLVEYYELIKPLADVVRQSLNVVNNVFTEYKKVKDAVSIYPTRWNTEKTKIINNLNKIVANKPSKASSSYRRATTNMFAYSQVNQNSRLNTDGSDVYDANFVSSKWIRVEPNNTYVWKSHSGNIVSPRVVYFTENLDYITTDGFSSAEVVTIKTGENVAYIQISARKDNMGNWKLEKGSKPTGYTANAVDLFPELRENNILDSVELNINSTDSIFGNINNFIVYINTISQRIDNTLGLYPNIVSIYNFGDLPCKPIIELTVKDPVDIRIQNLDTGESTTITNNVGGEKITLLNETEEIETSRTAVTGDYFKYDSHDDNFITLGEFENQLQFFGSYKVKIIYQFKIL